MSTPTGHSALQALQARQRSRASRTSSLFQPPAIVSPRSISKSRRARPRVECFSSAVARIARAHRAAVAASGTCPRRRSAAWRAGTRRRPRESGRRSESRPDGAAAEAQVGDDRVGVHDLSGVHLSVRVPDALELAEGLHQLRRRTSSAAARPATARRRARPRASRRRRARGRPPRRGTCGSFAIPVGRLEVEVQPRVDAAVPEVPVEVAAVAVPLPESAQVAQIVAELLGRDRRVLPSLPGQGPARRDVRSPEGRTPARARPCGPPRSVVRRSRAGAGCDRESALMSPAPCLPPLPASHRRARSGASRAPRAGGRGRPGATGSAACPRRGRRRAPRVPMGRCSRTRGTASAAAKTSGNPATSSTRAGGSGSGAASLREPSRRCLPSPRARARRGTRSRAGAPAGCSPDTRRGIFGYFSRIFSA